MNVNLKSGPNLNQPVDAEIDLVAFGIRLQGEIDRVLHSQRTMRRVNRALRSGRAELMQELCFSEEHAEELLARVRSGGDAFPEYALRNNAKLLRTLRKRLAKLQLGRQTAALTGDRAAMGMVKLVVHLDEACRAVPNPETFGV